MNKVYAMMIGCLNRFESFFNDLEMSLLHLEMKKMQNGSDTILKNEDALVKNSEAAKYRFLIGRQNHYNLIYIKNVLI